MAFSNQTQGRSWMVTVQVKNMIKAGLTEEQYKNPEVLAEFLINLWNNSGKGRKAGIAVCKSKDGLYHAHMGCYGNTTTLKKVSDVFYQSHVDPVLGTKRQLINYFKKVGKYADKGEEVLYTKNLEDIEDNQGKRNDLDDIQQLLENNMTPEQIFDTCFRYRKYEKMIKAAYLEKRIKETPLIKEMNNEYHWGDSGTGKTYTYIKKCEEYSPDEVYICNDYSNSSGSGGGFDFYANNAAKIIILDEFRGGMPFHQLLSILDVYSRNQQHCRFQNTYNLWTSVIICTILSPDELYKRMVEESKRGADSKKQLFRRLNLIVYHYKNERGKYKTYSMKPSEYISDADMINKARLNEMREESIRLKEEAKQTECEDISANNSEDEWSKMSEEERKIEAAKILASFGAPPEETTNTEKEEVKNNEE